MRVDPPPHFTSLRWTPFAGKVHGLASSVGPAEQRHRLAVLHSWRATAVGAVVMTGELVTSGPHVKFGLFSESPVSTRIAQKVSR